MILLAALIAVGLIVSGVWAKAKHPDNEGGPAVLIVLGSIFAFMICLSVTISTFNHAVNIGTVQAWQGVYDVYDRQLTELKDRLDTLNVQVGSEASILLNADTPAASMVNAYLQAQQQLAEQEAMTARAKVDIARRNAGPFWFVVRLYGDGSE